MSGQHADNDCCCCEQLTLYIVDCCQTKIDASRHKKEDARCFYPGFSLELNIGWLRLNRFILRFPRDY